MMEAKEAKEAFYSGGPTVAGGKYTCSLIRNWLSLFASQVAKSHARRFSVLRGKGGDHTR